MIDKIRLHLRGELPDEYRPNFGLSIGLDGTLCSFLGIEHSDLIERVRSDGTDEEILEWCYARGTRLNPTQKRVWNEFARKYGWNDRASAFLDKVRTDDGNAAETAHLVTAFELMDFREGRNATDAKSPSVG